MRHTNHLRPPPRWEVIYKLEIEDSANYDTISQVPYSINNAANYAEGSFSRIG
jgi:hypothetical protein